MSEFKFNEYRYKKFFGNEGYCIELLGRPRSYEKTCSWCLYVEIFMLKVLDGEYHIHSVAKKQGLDSFFEDIFSGTEPVTWFGDDEKPLRYGIDYAHSWNEESRGGAYYRMPWEGVPEDILLDINLVHRRLQAISKGTTERIDNDNK